MKVIKKVKGSALVGTVAIAAFLLITAAGFMRVVTNESIYEALALNNDHAFAAAESGALLGARWLRHQVPFPAPDQTLNPFTGLYVENTGCYVDVTIYTYLIGLQPNAQIISEAYNHPSERSENTFQKRIIYKARQLSFGDFGTFFNHSTPTWGGFYRRTFNGRFHMNERIIIHSWANKCTFSEKATIANELKDASWYTKKYGFSDFHHGNIYDYGVRINNSRPAPDPVTALDQMFLAQYVPNHDKIYLPQEIMDLNTGLPAHPDAVTLPASTDEGIRYSHYRPTLVFDENGSADYTYHSGGAYHTEHYDNVDEVIFYSKNNVNVHGIVNGNTTIVTNIGKSIVIVDDLYYKGYNHNMIKEDNWGINPESQSVLGLVTGKDVCFPHAWIEKIGDPLKTVIGSYGPVDGNGIGQLHVNASILAITDDGTENWDHSNKYYYDLFLTGNHILDLWYPPSAGENMNRGARNITFNHDQRLLSTLQPHGFPYLYTQDGLLLIALSGWSEQNNM